MVTPNYALRDAPTGLSDVHAIDMNNMSFLSFITKTEIFYDLSIHDSHAIMQTEPNTRQIASIDYLYNDSESYWGIAKLSKVNGMEASQYFAKVSEPTTLSLFVLAIILSAYRFRKTG